MKRIAALLLTALMCLSCMLVSCGPTEPGDTTTTAPGTTVTTAPAAANPAIAAIVGDYALDATPFGMPLSFYVRINADETFKISTKRDFSVDKGNGSVTESNGTFVFVYSDGTANEPKTATFTVVDGNLVFSTRVPVGSAGIDSDDVQNNPVTAYTLANEEVLGEYVGTYEKQSMMGTTLYEYSIVLAAGRKYTFTSSFTMGGTTYTLVETGSFTLNGTTFTITPKTVDQGMGAGVEAVTVDPVAGTLENGVITAAFKHSAMASSRVECTAQKAITAEVAGIYNGMKTVMAGPMGSMNMMVGLKLDKLGGYQYMCMSASAMGENMYGEQGTFTFTATEIILTKTHDLNPENGEVTPITGEATPVTVSRGALSVNGSFPTGGASTEATLYHESIVGPFEAECTAEEATDGIARTAQLFLDPNATFEITILVNDEIVYTVEGSFTVTKNPMTGTQLSLTLADESATLVGMVAEGMINVTGVPVDGNGTEISFGFSR